MKIMQKKMTSHRFQTPDECYLENVSVEKMGGAYVVYLKLHSADDEKKYLLEMTLGEFAKWKEKIQELLSPAYQI